MDAITNENWKEKGYSFVHDNEYRELDKAEAEKYFENDADSLEEIKGGKVAYLYYNGSRLMQWAIVEEGTNPANIEEWGEDDLADLQDKIRLIGD